MKRIFREKRTALQCNSDVTKCNTNKEKDKQEDKQEDKQIIDYLNIKANTRYKHNTDKTTSLINARINEGFTIDDFKKVIDIKCGEWLNDKTMNKYLRPITLFGTKFESYLNQIRSVELKEDGSQYCKKCGASLFGGKCINCGGN